MSVTEVVGAIGQWSVNLRSNTPRRILDQLDYWGHVLVLPGQTNIDLVGDNLFDSARYVGVLRARVFDSDAPQIGGGGLAIWLGDEDEKGYVFENKVTFTNADFNTVINTILPASVYVGTINTQAGLYTNTHQYKTPRTVLSYITETYGCEWRIRGKATVDVGTADQLYGTTPTAAIVRRLPQGGADVDIRALPGNSSLDADVEDFTTRLILIAEGNDQVVTQATADIDPVKNPYKDIKGQALVMKRMVSETDTSLSTAPTRAAMQLGRFDSPREAIRLSTRTHDLRGDVVPGGWIWVEDDDARLVDENNQVQFKGLQLRPMKLRVTELSWPIEPGMGVYYRHWSGSWVDLTPYVEWESGDTTVTVGDTDRPLTGGTGFQQPVSSAPVANDSIAPNTPVFTTPFLASLNTSQQTGLSSSEMHVQWTQPLNSDGSVVQDGNFYEIRYRTNAGSLQQPTNSEMSNYTNDQLKAMGTFDAPIQTSLGSWQYARVPWGTTTTRIVGLQPGMPYDWEIRAADTAIPTNYSAWSGTYQQTARRDTQAPWTPGAPDVALSPMAVQVNYGGQVAGITGYFNQVADVSGVEVHLGDTPTFEVYPDSFQFGGTMIGMMTYNIGMQLANASAVETFQLPSSWAGKPVYIKIVVFDLNNNRSPASEAANIVGELIPDAWIGNLTVSKLTAGYLGVNVMVGANIWTAQAGQRVQMGFYGIEAYNAAGTMTFDLNSADGSFFATGTIQSGLVGRRVVFSGATNDIIFYPEVGETRAARIYSYIPSNLPDDIALEMRSIDNDNTRVASRLYLLPASASLVTSPIGPGGDLVTHSVVSVLSTAVQIAHYNITGTGPFTSTMTCDWSVGGGSVSGQIYDTSFITRAEFGMYSTETLIRRLNDSLVDGGYLYLRKAGSGSDTIIGHRDSGGGGENYIRLMNSSLDMGFYKASVLKMKIGAIRTCVEALGSTGYSDERVVFNTSNGTRVMVYWQATGEMSFGNASSGAWIKNFVIDHPDDEKRYLVHACTESPQARVEYEDIAVVVDGFAEVELPSYFESLTREEGRAVQLTVLAEDLASERYTHAGREAPKVVWGGMPGEPHPGMPSPIGRCAQVMASYPKKGKFQIYAEGPPAFRVFWRVSAVRKDVPQFKVEPKKTEVLRHGTGPYTWTEEL